MGTSSGNFTVLAVVGALLMIGSGCAKRKAVDTPSPSHEPQSRTIAAETPSPEPAPINLAAAVDADIQEILDEVYGGGVLVEDSETRGEVEVVYQRRYQLERTHEADDDAKLEDALRGEGYTIVQQTPTTSLGILARKFSLADTDILVSAVEGSPELRVSITTM
ncbi:hypothetical protein [Enhygromyxa salina]|nr:hypothetical protein [Enhygromyxa salina]